MGLSSLKTIWHNLTHQHAWLTKGRQEIVWCGPRLPRANGHVWWKSGGYGSEWVNLDEAQLQHVLARGTLDGFERSEW